MQFDDYAAGAAATAVYPAAVRLVYPALGLCGEAGEAAEKVAGHVANASASDPLSQELGDVLWYLAVVAGDAGLRLSDLVGADDMAAHRDLVLAAQDVPASVTPPADLALALCAHAGRVAEHVKKILRDAGGEIDADRRARLAAALGRTVTALALLAESLDLTLAEIAAANLAKLAARARRGTLHGSGDDR